MTLGLFTLHNHVHIIFDFPLAVLLDVGDHCSEIRIGFCYYFLLKPLNINAFHLGRYLLNRIGHIEY